MADPRRRGGGRTATLAALLFTSAVCLALTSSWQLLPAAAQPPAALRLTAALVTAFELPGLLLVLLWPERLQLDLLEALPFGFAVSAVGLTALGIAAIELGLPLLVVQWVPVAVAGLLLLALVAGLATRAGAVRRPVRAVDLRPRSAPLVLLALVLVAAALAQVVGGLRGGYEPDLVEEAPQVVMAQRVATEPRLSADGLMYMRGVQATYYYPTYQLGLGLAARLAGVPPVAAFARVRGVATLLSLTGVYAAAVALLGSRRWARVVLLAGVVMTLSGQLSAPPEGLYWGPLAPLGHAADFGLGVVLPVGFAFAGRLLRRHTPWFYLAGTPLFLVSAMSLHSKEVLHLLTFFAAGTVALVVLLTRERSILLRAAGLTIVTVVVARGYQLMTASRVAYLGGFVEAQRAADLLELQGLAERGAWLARGSILALAAQLAPLPSLGLLLAPCLLLWRGRHPGAILLAAGCLFWAGLTNLAVLERLFSVLTYGEILWQPSRYLLLPGVFAAGTVVLLVAAVLTALASPARAQALTAGASLASPFWTRLAAAAGVLLCLSPVFRIALSLPARVGPQLLAVAALAAAAGTVAWRWLGARRVVETPWRALERLPVPALALVPPLIGLYLSSFSIPLWRAAADASARPPVEDLDRWYAQTSFARSLPLPLLRALEAAPPHRVVAAEAADSLVIPMFVPDYVLYSGWFYTTELRFLEQWEALQPQPAGSPSGEGPAAVLADYQRRQALLERLYHDIRPIFSESEDDQLTLRELSAWDVDYVVVDPARHTRLRRLLDSRPGAFVRVAETPERLLYEVRPPAR